MKETSPFYKDNAALARARLRPAQRMEPSGAALPETWNRIGGLLERLHRITGIAPAAALALWMVECGGLPFKRGRPVLRFENHMFFKRWGKDHEALFDQHFQFGGRGAIAGLGWEQHKFRLKAQDAWRRFHGDQSTEYQVFELAARLAAREAACLSASFGGPQIMGFNHALTGYENASAMFQAFGRAERWQVLAFFDFCRVKELGAVIAARDWHGFARVYNGPGNAEVYAARIAAAFAGAGDYWPRQIGR